MKRYCLKQGDNKAGGGKTGRYLYFFNAQKYVENLAAYIKIQLDVISELNIKKKTELNNEKINLKECTQFLFSNNTLNSEYILNIIKSINQNLDSKLQMSNLETNQLKFKEPLLFTQSLLFDLLGINSWYINGSKKGIIKNSLEKYFQKLKSSGSEQEKCLKDIDTETEDDKSICILRDTLVDIQNKNINFKAFLDKIDGEQYDARINADIDNLLDNLDNLDKLDKIKITNSATNIITYMRREKKHNFDSVLVVEYPGLFNVFNKPKAKIVLSLYVPNLDDISDVVTKSLDNIDIPNFVSEILDKLAKLKLLNAYPNIKSQMIEWSAFIKDMNIESVSTNLKTIVKSQIMNITSSKLELLQINSEKKQHINDSIQNILNTEFDEKFTELLYTVNTKIENTIHKFQDDITGVKSNLTNKINDKINVVFKRSIFKHLITLTKALRFACAININNSCIIVDIIENLANLVFALSMATD
jgi:hypothetical protein